LSLEQQRTEESQKNITIAQQSLKVLSDRISLSEGQSARLAALENKVQQSISLPTVHNISQSILQTSFNVITSTTLSNPPQSQTTVPLNISSFSVPKSNNILPSHIAPVNNNSTISNTSGISLDYTKLAPYDGKLTPTHPEEFLEQAEQYFLTQPPLPDQLKIN